MSEAYESTETALAAGESNVYDRGVDGAIALGIVSFALGWLALAGIVPLDASGSSLSGPLVLFSTVVVGGVGILGAGSYANVVQIASRRVRGIGVAVPVVALLLTALAQTTDISLATLFGLVLLAEAAGVAAAGITSRVGVVDTSPDPSAGLLAGCGFGLLGLLVGAALGGSLVGFDTPLWMLAALLTGVGFATMTVVPREDLGSTLPVAILVGVFGLTVATGTIGVGWQWDPETISGGFIGGTVVPMFVLVGAVVSSWAAAKCRAGFGAQGRQYGAFFVINLNAVLMLVVMVTVVLFVASKGIGFAFHGFQIGALSALVLLAPVLFGAVRFARTPAGSAEWKTGARQFVRVLPLTAVGSLAAVFVWVLVTRDPIVYDFTYNVLVNRQQQALDTTAKLTSELAVGSGLLVFSAGVLFAYFFRRYNSLQSVGTAGNRLRTVRRVLPAGAAVGLAVVGAVLVGGQRPFGVPLAETVAPALVWIGAAGVLGLAITPLVVLVLPEGSRRECAIEGAPHLVVSTFGGLGVLLTTLVVQQVGVGIPTVGGLNIVPVVALGSAGMLGAAGLVITLARRRTDDTLGQRLLGEELTLTLAGVTGFTTLAGLHVWLTGSSLTVAGVTISSTGTLSWPMTMQSYIPLGPEPGGIFPAVVGTVWLVLGATLFAVPLGVGAAVFLTEYAEQGRFTTVVEVATNALWSTPSVVFGLFGGAFLIPRLGGDTSLLAGMLVLSFMLLPLVLITSREAIKAVPDEYRDASAALGVNRWQTIRSVVLPAAMPGVITGAILGIGRIAGETAPLILVLGSTLNASSSVNVIDGFKFVGHPPFVANDQLLSASASLPTQVWGVIAAGVSGSPSMGWGTAFILLTVVLVFYSIGIATRKYFRRKIQYE